MWRYCWIKFFGSLVYILDVSVQGLGRQSQRMYNMNGIIEAARLFVEAVRVLVETVRVLVEAVRVIVEG